MSVHSKQSNQQDDGVAAFSTPAASTGDPPESPQNGPFSGGSRDECARECAYGVPRRQPRQRRPYSYTRELRSLSGAIQRCHNPRCKAYGYYGARGIEVCAEWRGPNGRQLFIDCVGRKPTRKHSLDRIDNDGNYERRELVERAPIDALKCASLESIETEVALARERIEELEAVIDNLWSTTNA